MKSAATRSRPRGEDRRQHGDAEDAADLADRVRRTGGLALVTEADRAEDDVRHRGEEHAHADPGDDERADERRIGDVRRGHRRHPGKPDRLQCEPDRPGTAGRRSGRRARPRSARRSSASPSRAAPAGRPRRASIPARSGRTARAGRSSRTCRSTSRARRRSRPKRHGRGRNEAAASAASPRASQATNAARSTAPATREPRICGLVQPSALPCTSPQTIPSRPPLASASPRRSSEVSGPWLSVSSRASGSTASPIGTLSQKIHCQAIPSTTAPPTSGPAATARPAMPDQAPSATPRFSEGNAAERSVRVSGVTIAPPTPFPGPRGPRSAPPSRARARLLRTRP